jgi:hypothetical protein
MRKIPAIALIAGFILAVIFALNGFNTPPSDDDVVRQFDANKYRYEKLRDLFLQDEAIYQVSRLGVQRSGNPVILTPPIPEISKDRYQRYLKLLSSLKVLQINRFSEVGTNMCALFWRSGFGGETTHVVICWFDNDLLATSHLRNRFKIHSMGDHWYILRGG